MKTLQTWAIAFAMPPFALGQAAADSPAATTAASRLHYESAFADYKPYQDVPVADWRQVNDAVRDAATKGGGHAGHGSATPPASGSTAPAGAGTPSATPPEKNMGHGGHGGHSEHGGHGGQP